MDKHILIDLNELKVLKAVEGLDALRRCEYWADILIPQGEFYVCGTTKRDLSTFNHSELSILFKNTRNRKLLGREYTEATSQVQEMLEDFPCDDTCLADLVKKLGKPLKEVSFVPAPEKIKEASSSSDIPTRPKDGTMTVRAWEAADYFYSQQEIPDLDSKALRDQAIQACVDTGVNSSTASTQFAKWKRHQKAS